jgi:V/A-type H+-transporting ATPase subunit I
MAIVKMKKATLAAPKNQRDGILNLIQAKGYIQLLDLKEKSQEFDGVDFYKEGITVNQSEVEYSKIKFTYDFLRQYSNKKESMFAKREIISKEEFYNLEQNINWQNIYVQCKEIEDALNQNKTKKSKAIAQIEQFKSWVSLDLSVKELDKLRKTTYFIGSISKKYEAKLYEEISNNYKDVYIEKISEKQQETNLFILCYALDSHQIFDILKKYGFTKVNLELEKSPIKQIEALNMEIEELNKETADLIKRAEKLSESISYIEKVYDYIESRLEKERAISKLVKTHKTFILQGWLPEDRAQEFEDFICNKVKDVYLYFEDPEEGEIPPIALKNNVLVEPFEVITSMYALPLPQEVDPTPVLTPFFLLFFGMMMADIGYGIVMLVASTFLLRYSNMEGEGRKILKLIQYCSVPTIIFGLLYGSFFGGIIKMTPLWLDPVNQPLEVLKVAIALGIVHLYVGLGVKAYSLIKSGKILDAIYDVLFWYGLVSGLIWLLLGGGTPAKLISIISAVGLVLTQGRSNQTILGKLFGGLYGLYGITSYLGDALSYSRLLALGLASGLIGWSFNLLIGLLGKGVVALIFGPIIFLAGHTFNFLIGALGTFVHTCRLQYLEFFGKFYEGGGSAFEPLKIKTKFIKVNVEPER